MANTKEFFIKINGITTSSEEVATLREQLDGLSKACEETNKASKTAAAGSDELSKATVKLMEYDREYQTALQQVKSEISSRNKEVKDAVSLEQSWKTVQEGTLETYRDKQRMITAIGNILKSTNAQTDEEKQKLEELKETYVRLNDELKAYDAELGNHQRNVGNYTSASQDMKSELKEITDRMVELLANGTSKLDPEFQKLAKRAGEIKDAIGDAKEEIKRFASDTKVIDDVVNLATTATNAFQLWKGVTSLLQIENEHLLEVMQQLQSIQAVTQAFTNLSNAFQAGTASAKALNLVLKVTGAQMLINQVNTLKATVAQTGMTAAQKAGAIASKALGVAMKSIPLMAIIGLVLTLITNWKGVVKWFEDTIPAIRNMNTWFDKVMGTIRGVGNAVLNWLVNPIKTFAKTMVDLVNLDFKKAWEDIKNGVTNQLQGTVDAYTKGYENSMDASREREGRKIIAQKQKEIEAKLEVIRAKEKYDKKYSDQRIALEKKNFLYRKALASRNKEEYNKIKAEEAEFDATVENQKTKATEQGLKDRATATRRAAAEEKARLREEQAAEKERQKQAEKEAERQKKIAIEMANATQRYRNAELDRELASGDYKIERIITRLNKLVKKDQEGYIDTIKDTSDIIGGIVAAKIEEMRLKIGSAIDNAETDMKTGLIGLSMDLAHAVEMNADNLFVSVASALDKAEEKLKDEKEILSPDGYTERLVETIMEELGVLDKYRAAIDTTDKKLTDEEVERRKELQAGLQIWAANVGASVAEVVNETDKLNQEYGKLIGSVAEFGEDGEFTFTKLIGLSETELRVWNEVGETIKDKISYLTSFAENSVDNISSYLNGKTADVTDSIFKESSKLTDKILKDAEKQTMKLDPKKNATVFDRLFNRKELKKQEKDYREHWDVIVSRLGTIHSTMREKWSAYLQTVAKLHGTESQEYQNALREMLQAELEFQEKVAKAKKAAAGENYEEPQHRSNESFVGINKDQWGGEFGKQAEELADSIKDTFDVLFENVFDPLYEGFSALLEFQIEEAQEKLEKAEKMHDESVERVEASQSRIQELNDLMKQSSGQALEEFKKQQADEMLLLAQREAEEKRLAREKEKREKELQKKEKQQKKLELKMDLVTAIANTAEGVTKALTWGWPLGAIFSAIIGAMGAVEVATITKQLSKLADGGLLKGKSHAQGGIPVGNTGIEVEGGEAVINRKSTAMYAPILDAINAAGNGGKHTILNSYKAMSSHADGGQLNFQRVSSSLERNGFTGVIDAIESIDMQPVVAVSEINRVQKNVVRVKELAGV